MYASLGHLSLLLAECCPSAARREEEEGREAEGCGGKEEHAGRLESCQGRRRQEAAAWIEGGEEEGRGRGGGSAQRHFCIKQARRVGAVKGTWQWLGGGHLSRGRGSGKK